MRFDFWTLATAIIFSSTAAAQSRTVAITVDDVPIAASANPTVAASINAALLDAFTQQGVRAVGFVNEKKIQQIGARTGHQILEDWLRSGMQLGNHTYSHADLNDLTPEAFNEEVTRGEETLRQQGRSVRYFRFPFNHTGDTAAKRDAADSILAKKGYTVAVCTIDNTDYEFARTYDLMLQRNDKTGAQRLIEDYLAHTNAVIDYYIGLHEQIFKRETPHVMLLHANQLNAAVISRLLSLFTQKQFRFVTLDEAQSDAAYSTPEGPPTRFGPMWGYRWAKAKGIKVDGSKEPELPSWISAYLQQSGN